jgi:hypothetical protein
MHEFQAPDWKTAEEFKLAAWFYLVKVARTKMKRSSAVVLVISGAVLAGCDSSSSDWGSSQTYTNNHYVTGRGYYHAPYHAWYPFPYNYYDPARRGYYHGGNYTSEPHVSAVTASRPAVRTSSHSSSVRRGGFSIGRSSSS